MCNSVAYVLHATTYELDGRRGGRGGWRRVMAMVEGGSYGARERESVMLLQRAGLGLERVGWWGRRRDGAGRGRAPWWLGREFGLPFAVFPCFPTYPLWVVFFPLSFYQMGFISFKNMNRTYLGQGFGDKIPDTFLGCSYFRMCFLLFFPGCGENILILK